MTTRSWTTHIPRYDLVSRITHFCALPDVLLPRPIFVCGLTVVMAKAGSRGVARLSIAFSIGVMGTFFFFLFPVYRECPYTHAEPRFETLTNYILRKFTLWSNPPKYPVRVIIAAEGRRWVHAIVKFAPLFPNTRSCVPHWVFSPSALTILCLWLCFCNFAQNGHWPFRSFCLLSFRSGSTFLGALFNSEKTLLYSYEPCRAIFRRHVKLYNKAAYPQLFYECNALLSKLVHCRMTAAALSLLYSDAPAVRQWSTALLERKSDVQKLVDKDATIRCHGKQNFNSRCDNYRAVVLKTIRLKGIPREFRSGDVKILHLVRDPRAVALSQSMTRGFSSVFPLTNRSPNLAKEERLSQYAAAICEKIRLKLRDAQRMTKLNYKLVRYEDIFANPHGFAKDVFNWIGIEKPSSEVYNWIDSHTSDSSSEASEGEFTTKRKSSQVVGRWKTIISPVGLANTTSICRDVLKELGYPLTLPPPGRSATVGQTGAKKQQT